ncbi:separase isoform x1 [Hordeum vulgare]|nr:separase isoform x1 [Hordeum vulgare]
MKTTMLPPSSADDDLLTALSSPSSRVGLHSRFVAYLQPFYPHLPAVNPAQAPAEEGNQAGQADATPPLPLDAVVICPLVKRFRTFLCRVLQLLLPLLRLKPSDAGDVEGLDGRCGGTQSLHPLVLTGVSTSVRRNLYLVSSERRGGEK